MNDIALSNSLIKNFKRSITEIDSLMSFLDISIKAIAESEQAFEKEYKYGVIISDAFNSIFEEEDIEKQKEKIKKVKNIDLHDGIKIKDILDISISDDDIREDSLFKFSFSPPEKYGIKGKYYNPKEVENKRCMCISQRRMLSLAILSNLIIIFESYLSTIYEMLVLIQNDNYLKGKQIYISEILNNDINKIIHKTVRDEVEQNMYDSLKTLDKMKDNSGFNIDRYIKIRKQFEEIYYRRNVYVHNNGIANEIYFSKVDKKYLDELKLGEYLLCDEKYLRSSIQCTKKVLCSMFYEILHTEICTNDEPYNYLGDCIGFNALCSKEYEVAEYIFFILKSHKGFEYRNKAIYLVNYMNALKQQGKDISKELSLFDVSALQNEFRIAKLCLQDKYEDAYKLLAETYPNTFDATSIRDWPLFIGFRKTEYYQTFKEAHLSDFNEFTFKDTNSEKCEIKFNSDESDKETKKELQLV